MYPRDFLEKCIIMKKTVALKYNDDLPAPLVISKGERRLAEKILRIAKKNDIAVVEMPELLENLYELSIGSVIPEDLYEIVADILLFVYNIQEKNENN